MRLETSVQEKRLLPIVTKACSAIAGRYGLDPRDGQGYVLCKILERLDHTESLARPLEHYANSTAWPEAYRFFSGKYRFGHRQKED